MTNFKQPNYSTLSPCVIVEDVSKSVDFYTKAFGFEILEKHEREGAITGATLKLGEVSFMLFDKKSYCSSMKDKIQVLENKVKSGMSLYAYCSDVDALYKNAVAVGAQSLMEPQDAFWGDRFCQLLDIDGYEWCFATYKQS